MATINRVLRSTPIFTHEGARAKRISPEQQLRRTVCCCLLWEDSFYEDGQSVADRIKQTIPLVKPEIVAQIAIDCREKFKLRHVPLFIIREMARLSTHKYLVAETLIRVVQRADELAEFLTIYWKDGKQPLSAQVKRGLSKAFGKFNEYQLAKYNRDKEIKLRDVLFLCHPKAENEEQDALWKRLINGTLAVPDTWEVEISKNKSNKASWERLLIEKKLGGLALLRNLRNMIQAGVNEDLIWNSLETMKADRILPFRFITAARYAKYYEPVLEKKMLECLSSHEKLPGKTALLVDGSGSMFGTRISQKSELERFDAACALAILLREICERVNVSVFSYNNITVPPRRGFALADVLHENAERGGTYTQSALNAIIGKGYDRIIVLTDEQSHQTISAPLTKGYVVNVASYQNGIGYGNWLHVDGWSEAIVDFIIEMEKLAID